MSTSVETARAFRVACVTCAAKPGEPCILPGGAIGPMHKDRVFAAWLSSAESAVPEAAPPFTPAEREACERAAVEGRRKVVYLAAPVSPTTEQIDREIADDEESDHAFAAMLSGDNDGGRASASRIVLRSNLRRARRWLRWLVESTDWSIVASWMPYVETLDEEKWRARGLTDDLAVVERCDAIVLVGGRVSSGMALERDHAVKAGIIVVDLTGQGEEPPGDALRSYQVVSALWEAWKRDEERRRG